ncbi:MAG: mevalonate kinase [Anaerolineae bacterium]|jgi:mevalonate kinase
MTHATAPGKIILFGEHAVVYRQPAIAVPVHQLQAEAVVESAPAGQGTQIIAPDVDRFVTLADAPDDDALARIVDLTLEEIGRPGNPDLTITVRSTIPIARGLGSGAAISTAIVRALCAHYAHWIASRRISDLVYQAELIYHGTPSGIDNTVIAFEKPIFFVKEEGWEIFWPGQAFLLAIADTGVESATWEVVRDVRRQYEAERDRYTALFRQTGAVALGARSAIEEGEMERLGRLMDENHTLLQEMGVSSPELDRLVAAARQGGALGAKLSGAGRGGNAIALVTEETRGCVDMMLRLAGATDVLVTEVQ